MGKKKNRAYKRGEAYADAIIIAIACEGDREVEYFKAVGKGQKRIKVIPLGPKGSNGQQTQIGHSSPKHVLERAYRLEKDFLQDPKDQLWLVLDRDRWEQASLEELRQYCTQHAVKPRMAMSNPCFEVWLYLHYRTISSDTPTTCKKLKGALNELEPWNAEIYAAQISQAAERAETGDQAPDVFYPGKMQTRVYRLANALGPFMNTSW